MAETFSLSELIVPGAYIRVQAEALIGIGGVSTGNIGIVGTASDGAGETHLFSEYGEISDAVGDYDAYDDGNGDLNLGRALELAYRTGAGTVFARALPAGANKADFTAAFAQLAKDDVNILVAPELSTDDASAVLGADRADGARTTGRTCIAVVGSDADAPAEHHRPGADERPHHLHDARHPRLSTPPRKTRRRSPRHLHRRRRGRAAQHAGAAVEPDEQGRAGRRQADAAVLVRGD